MSGKRSATSELNDRNWDQEEESEEAGVFVQADADTLKNRVIKKAKRRGINNDEGKSKSIFSTFGGFGSTKATPSAAKAFDFLSSSNGSSNGDKKTASFSFGSNAGSSTNGSSGVTPGFAFGAKPAEPPKATPSFAFGSPAVSKDEGDKSVAVGSPVFGTPAAETKKPTAAPSFFGNFTSPKSSEVKTDEKEESVPSVAAVSPSVTSTQPKPTSGGFDFGGLAKPAGAVGAKWTCDACMVSNPDDKDICLCCETPKPGAPVKKKPTEASAPAFQVTLGAGFKFGATPASDTSKSTSGFSFGSTATSASSTSTGFKFGASSEVPKKDPTPVGGGFKFGAKSSDNDKDDKTESAKPSSSSEDQTKEYLTQLSALNKQFAKWISQNVEQDSLVLLTPCIKDYENHLEELKKKYREPLASKKAVQEKPAPANIPEPSKKEDKPLLGAFFGAKSSPAKDKEPEKSTGFTFGTKGDSVGGFSFGSSTPKSEATGTGFTFKPASEKSEATPNSLGFSFGLSSGSSEPAKAGFSFGAGSSLPAFGTGSSSMFGAAAAQAMAAKKDEPAQAEEETEEQPPKVEVTTVVEEDSIHSVRCKLFFKKDKEFADKGLGMLHLKKVEGGKIQMLVRAETNLGNILLNIFLSPQMNLVNRGKNLQFVCVPNPPIAGVEGPVMMLIKVKTEDMAAILEEKIKEQINHDSEC